MWPNAFLQPLARIHVSICSNASPGLILLASNGMPICASDDEMSDDGVLDRRLLLEQVLGDLLRVLVVRRQAQRGARLLDVGPRLGHRLVGHVEGVVPLVQAPTAWPTPAVVRSLSRRWSSSARCWLDCRRPERGDLRLPASRTWRDSCSCCVRRWKKAPRAAGELRLDLRLGQVQVRPGPGPATIPTAPAR